MTGADNAEIAEGAEGDEAVTEELFGAPVVSVFGQKAAFVERDSYLAFIGAARGAGFEMCADLCAVDYLGNTQRPLPPGVVGERFEVVVNLVSLSGHGRLRARVQVPESDPCVASLFSLYPGTEAMEREAYDLMGIRFDGHPDLCRVLLPDEWEGHPLRKDYVVARVPVQFKAAQPGVTR